MLNLAAGLSLSLFLLPAITPISDSSGSAPSPPHVRRSDEAGRVYQELLSKPMRDRAKLLAQMSASMQSRVWAHHLLTALVQHPDLTTEQRAVMQEALTILTPQLFEIESSDPRWPTLVDMPLRRLHARAMAVFPDKRLAREIFAQLGPEVSSVPEDQPGSDSNLALPSEPARRDRPRLISTDTFPDCTCSTDSDYCDWSGLGIYYCKHDWCVIKRVSCGTFFRHDCTGMCYTRST